MQKNPSEEKLEDVLNFYAMEHTAQENHQRKNIRQSFAMMSKITEEQPSNVINEELISNLSFANSA